MLVDRCYLDANSILTDKVLSLLHIFFSNIKKKTKGGKKGQRSEESSGDWEDSDDEDDFSDLDDEEVSLGSMEEEFGEDMDEEGGVFMDVSDDDNSLGKVPLIIKK